MRAVRKVASGPPRTHIRRCTVPAAPPRIALPYFRSSPDVFGLSLRHSISKWSLQHYGASGRSAVTFEQIDTNMDGAISKVEWTAFQEKAAAMPTRLQLRRHAVACAVPMVGFGAMDNFIMIQAGDYIDTTIGVSFGMATMTAAACGQICSDFSGVMFGGTVEALANRLGLPLANLTPAQARIPQVKMLSTGSAAVGVVIGCIIGMCSLLFMDLDKADRLRRAEELEGIFEVVFAEGKELLSAEQVNLYLMHTTEEGKVFVNTRTQYSDPPDPNQVNTVFERFAVEGAVSQAELVQMFHQLDVKVGPDVMSDMIQTFDITKTGKLNHAEFAALITNVVLRRAIDFELNPNGFLNQVRTSGKPLSVANPSEHLKYKTSRLSRSDQMTGSKTHALLYGPIKNDSNEVIGVIQMKNKKTAQGYQTFSDDDRKVVQMLCSHVAIFLKQSEGRGGD